MSKTFFVHVLDRSKSTPVRNEYKVGLTVPATKNLLAILTNLNANDKTKVKASIPTNVANVKASMVGLKVLGTNPEKLAYGINKKCVQTKKKPAYVATDGTTCYGTEGSVTAITELAKTTGTDENAGLLTSAAFTTDPWATGTSANWLIKIEIPGNNKFPWEKKGKDDDDDDDDDDDEDKKDDDMTFFLLLGGSLLLACLTIIFALLFLYM